MQSLTQSRPLNVPVDAVRPGLVRRFVAAVIDADARYRQKMALRAMSAERLADMGMSAADVARAFR